MRIFFVLKKLKLNLFLIRALQFSNRNEKAACNLPKMNREKPFEALELFEP